MIFLEILNDNLNLSTPLKTEYDIYTKLFKTIARATVNKRKRKFSKYYLQKL